MNRIMLPGLILCFLSLPTFANEGIVTLQSKHNVEDTVERLYDALGAKGMRVFAEIKHDEGAMKAGLTLNPTRLVIFGNPKVGTPLMQCDQKTGLDLPQKMLVWQDTNGLTWLSYNDPAYLGKRHQLEKCKPVLEKVKKALAGFAKAATD